MNRFEQTVMHGGGKDMKSEKLKKLSKRIGRLFVANTVIPAVFLPMFATMVLANVLACMASDWHHVFAHPEWSCFGDGLAVLLFFMAALCFRSRLCAALAAVTACVNLLLKIFTLVLYRETFMGTDFKNLKLLWIHTDAFAIRAVLGKNYALWLIPAVLAVLAAIGALGYLAWKTIRNLGRRSAATWKVFTGILLVLAVVNIGVFLHAEKLDPSEVYTGHLVQPLPVAEAYFIRDALCVKPPSAAVPLGEKSRKLLEEMEVIPRQVTPPPPARFDRIIIIAVESLDLAFIRAVNPEMPEGVTPNLDRLITEYPAMKNYFCSSQPTSWGLTGILLSRFDYERVQNAAEKRPSLFSIASDLGYRSCYFSSLTGVFADNRRIYNEVFAPDRQYFLEEWKRKYGMRHSFAWGISDRELYSCVLKEMSPLRGKRFVVLISTMDTHPPYTADGISEADRERFSTPFLRGLHMTDHHLGEFLRQVMADPGLYDDRTLIVVTADHSATHGENYTKRKALLPDRIPLIFITRDRNVFRELDRSKFASSIDLTPTLVNFIGGEIPESFIGRDLFSRKNIAISWFGDTPQVRSPRGEFYLPIDSGSSDPEKQALIDFLRSHY